MPLSTKSLALEALLSRRRPDGGFSGQSRGPNRPDATAWAAIALDAAGDSRQAAREACERLARDQLADGRVSLDRRHPETWWPTPLAALAWHGHGDQDAPRRKAIEFLLSTMGNRSIKKKDSPFAHDTALRGWSWIEDTHAWVEPTAMSLLALAANGHAGHPRSREAIRLLLDRQLPHGGWNYGNTLVFGRELRPDPESTGAALGALAGRVARPEIELSLDYLIRAAGKTRAPLSLAWTLLALGAWGLRPPQAQSWIDAGLDAQSRLGPYHTSHLALLAVASFAPRGLASLFTPPAEQPS